MADKKDVQRSLARLEAALKRGDAADPKKKAELIRLVRELKAEIRADEHGPLDELLHHLDRSAVGLETSHPALTAVLDHISRLLASIGI